ncbi:MAG TPA: sulfotransferase [Pseudonocardiaceae bacterium]|jgi:hypothetical protein|nr:sulfotransferase [Pseudonocardiaceae bacterium]
MVDVVGAGFGRTGTLSLKAALERLGFGPCLHMEEVLASPDATARWTGVGPDADWDALFRGYRSTVDWPGARFWRELVGHYPAAPVILTVRDRDAWYDSADTALYRPYVHVRDGNGVAAMKAMLGSVIWDGTFDGRFADRDHALRVFDEHSAAVRREIPAQRLLVFEVAQGWAPLCDFLGVPVPDEPFPHLNDRASFLAKQQARLAARGAV